jgi:hypothetical protein
VWLAGGAHALEHFSTAWSTYVGGEYDNDRISAVAVDGGSAVYMGGACLSGSIQNNAGETFSLASPGFVAKASPGGALLWGRDFAACANYQDEILALAAGPSSTFAVGYTRGSYADSGTYAFIAALDASDGSLAWHDKSIGHHFTDDDFGTNAFNAVAVAADGTVYAVGHTSLSNQVCNVSAYQAGGVTYGTNLIGGTDAFVVKYSSAGAVLWRRYLGGARDDSATAVALGPDGHVYVAGQTRSSGWVSLAASGTANATNAAGFLVKLTAAGTHVWSSYLNGSGHDAVAALSVWSAGVPPASVTNVLFLGGATASSDFLASAPRLGTAYAGGTDGFVARLTDTNTAFRIDWCRFAGGAAADQVSSLGLLADGRLAAGGTTASGGWLTPFDGSEAFHGTRDGFAVLLDAASGALSWATCIGGAGEDRLHALAASSNAFFTAGHTLSTNWVGGGFWTEWNKSNLWGDDPLSFGFAVKWQPGAPIPPAIIAEPADRAVQEGAPVTFTAAAAGTAPLFYRWFRNGEPIAGATLSNLAFTAAYADNGAAYSCLVSNIAGTAETRAALLTVIPMGTLTVSLSPPDAVARGARWRLNGGPAWLPSGLSTNLPVGAYDIGFTNLAGWTAPAPLSGVQVAHAATTSIAAAYTPVLPEAERVIVGTNVSVTVRAPAGLASWTLVENLPPGLTPTNITAGGVWNGGARTLTFTGPEAATNTFSYRVICATSGVYTVGGTVTPAFASVPVPVSGDTRLISARLIRTVNGTSVTITVVQPSATRTWYVDETIPEGLTPVNITGPNAYWDDETRVLNWYLRGVGQTLTYEVEGQPGTYTLSGLGNVTGTDEPIFGDTVLTIPDVEPLPTPDILSFVPVPPDAFALTFVSVEGQAYTVITNAAPGAADGWAACGAPLTGAAGATQCEVPRAGPRLFYRVRALE